MAAGAGQTLLPLAASSGAGPSCGAGLQTCCQALLRSRLASQGRHSHVGQAVLVGQAFEPAADIPVGLSALTHCPLPPNRVCRGGSACPPHCSPWSMPPGLPHRQSCRWSAWHYFPSAAVVHALFVRLTFLSPSASCGADSCCVAGPLCGAGFPAGLGTLYPPPSAQPNRVCRGGPTCPPHCPPWSKPPGLPHRQIPWSTQSCVPHRQSCRWSASAVLLSPFVEQASKPAAGIPASLSHRRSPTCVVRPACEPLCGEGLQHLPPHPYIRRTFGGNLLDVIASESNQHRRGEVAEWSKAAVC